MVLLLTEVVSRFGSSSFLSAPPLHLPFLQSAAGAEFFPSG